DGAERNMRELGLCTFRLRKSRLASLAAVNLDADHWILRHALTRRADAPRLRENPRKPHPAADLYTRSGRFYGTPAPEGFIQEGHYPRNNGHIGKVKHVPAEAPCGCVEVEQ